MAANSIPELGQAARNHLRDFPVFFEDTYQPLQSATVKLSHPLIASLELRSVADGTEVTDFHIDYRNGVVKLNDPESLQAGIYAVGYHYEWFLDEDLTYFAELVVNEHLYDRTDLTELSQMSGPEQHTIAIGTLVYALWSLVTEFSTEIDVSTPEGMMIPAHMRFQQTLQLFQYWKQKYDEMAASLNVGLMKISVKELRRVSRLTNRYVPTFRGREVDDPRPPIRVFPQIDPIVPSPEEGGSEGGSLNMDYGIAGEGWTTLGTSGG